MPGASVNEGNLHYQEHVSIRNMENLINGVHCSS